VLRCQRTKQRRAVHGSGDTSMEKQQHIDGEAAPKIERALRGSSDAAPAARQV